MVVNMESAFKFPLKDKKWLIKVLIGGILIWIPVVNFLVLGYLLKVLGDAKDKKEAVLPEWADWPVLFQEGFMAFVVWLCYGSVLIISSVLVRIPFIGCLLFPIQVVVGFLLWPFVSIALCCYLEKRELSSAFDFKRILETFKANLADYLIIALVLSALAFCSIITLVLVIFIWFYLSVVSFRLYGELFSTGKSS